MKKKLRIKRRSVLRALETESLSAGTFFRKFKRKGGGFTTYKNLNVCAVCAVGAVLRRTVKSINSLTFDEANKVGYSACNHHYVQDGVREYIEEELDGILKDKNYLGALSVYFEYLMADRKVKTATRRIKNKLSNFVVENFPKEFDVTIDVEGVKL